MVQIVASIEYEAARPPDGLPDDMEPLPGVSLGYLAIKAIDSFIVHAALWQPENKPPAETTIIVMSVGGIPSGCQSAAWILNPSIALIDRNRSEAPGSGSMSSGRPSGGRAASYSMLAAIWAMLTEPPR